jgi:hypothetical protein
MQRRKEESNEMNFRFRNDTSNVLNRLQNVQECDARKVQ